jgi:hypothetical protein
MERQRCIGQEAQLMSWFAREIERSSKAVPKKSRNQ